jgi:hypothetical protein
MHTCKCEKHCAKSSRGREVLECFVPFKAHSEHENNAHAPIVEGFSNLMPKTFASLKDSDIEDLIGYLKTLN